MNWVYQRTLSRVILIVHEGIEGDQSDESRREDLHDFLPYCQSELPRKGVTRQILWAEYRGRYPGGYSYSQFCEYLKQYLDRKDVSLHIEQQPGDKLYIDFAGSKMSIADPYTGEIKEVEVFVAVLGYSGRTYVRACESQRKEDFLSCIVRALNYLEAFQEFLFRIILSLRWIRLIRMKQR